MSRVKNIYYRDSTVQFSRHKWTVNVFSDALLYSCTNLQINVYVDKLSYVRVANESVGSRYCSRLCSNSNDI